MKRYSWHNKKYYIICYYRNDMTPGLYCSEVAFNTGSMFYFHSAIRLGKYIISIEFGKRFHPV